MNSALQLVLASVSPRRVELLKRIGIEPSNTEAADIDEAPDPRERPADLVRRLAEAKTAAIAVKYPDHAVLGADTVVALGRRILTKPADADVARAYLTLLSGRRHSVYGGICVIAPAGKSVRVVKTSVRFKRLSEIEIEAYVAGGEWRDKAGGYAIQGAASAFVPAINGSYTNIVGLSVTDAKAMLQGLGFKC